ncbi:unnamed protein product [Alopecurus aequalis]
MGRGGVFAWLLVAGLLLGSCTSPAACASRLLPVPASAEVRAVGVAEEVPGGAAHTGGERVAMLMRRRSLFQRLSRPPSPVPNTPRSSGAPGPPPRLA